MQLLKNWIYHGLQIQKIWNQSVAMLLTDTTNLDNLEASVLSFVKVNTEYSIWEKNKLSKTTVWCLPYCMVCCYFITIFLKRHFRAFLVVQCLRICLSMQGMWVQSLFQKDPPCLRATKSMSLNYWVLALEPMNCKYWTHSPQLLNPECLEPVLCNERPRQ